MLHLNNVSWNTIAVSIFYLPMGIIYEKTGPVIVHVPPTYN